MFVVKCGACCAGMLLLAAAAGSGAAERPKILPNPEIQAQIDRTLKAFQDASEDDIPDAFREIGKLHVIKRRQEEELLRQLVYSMSRAMGEDALEVVWLIEMCNFGHSAKVHALAPYMDAADPKIVQSTRNVLETVPDFSYYRGYLQGHKRDPPLGLVGHMYRTNPEEGLRALMDVYMTVEATEEIWRRVAVVRRTLRERGEDGKIPPEAKREAIEQLDALARLDGWWVRLYVPAIIRHQIDFRPSEVLKLLARDKHVLVKRAALEVLNERAAKELPPAPEENRRRINELEKPKK